MITPGAKLRTIRNLRNLSQTEFARRVSLQQWVLSALETDHVSPNAQLIDTIEAAFGVRLDSPEVEAAFVILSGHNGAPQSHEGTS